MSEFETHLTTLLDDVAASIQPRSNFDAVARGGSGVVVPTAGTAGGGRSFRRTVAIAAASVMLLGGIAAAAYPRDDGEADLVATASSLTAPTTTGPDVSTTVAAERPSTAERSVAPAPADPAERPDLAPAVEYSAAIGEGQLDAGRIEQVVFGTAAPEERVLVETEHGDGEAIADALGRWRLELVLDDVAPGKVVFRVTFGRSEQVFELVVEIPGPPATTVPPKPEPEPAPEPKPEPEPAPEPKPEPKPEPEPEPVDFTAELGGGEPWATPMKQVLYGTATPGSKILATSAYGHATATAGPKGGWELLLKMYEVPAPSAVRITVTVSTGGPEFEFWVDRPAPKPEPEPEPIDFTASVANTYFDGELTKVVLYGTGRPGSGVLASSEYGAEDARVGEKGNWELHLKLWDIPAGHEAGVRVTNTAAEAVHEFVVHQPEPEPAPEPEPVEFTANAALTESDRTPPVNEYWGTLAPGAKVKIDSEYGSTHVVAGDDGVWDARLEFPEAPVGVTFTVVVWSPEREAEFTFPFTRLPPE